MNPPNSDDRWNPQGHDGFTFFESRLSSLQDLTTTITTQAGETSSQHRWSSHLAGALCNILPRGEAVAFPPFGLHPHSLNDIPRLDFAKAANNTFDRFLGAAHQFVIIPSDFLYEGSRGVQARSSNAPPYLHLISDGSAIYGLVELDSTTPSNAERLERSISFVSAGGIVIAARGTSTFDSACETALKGGSIDDTAIRLIANSTNALLSAGKVDGEFLLWVSNDYDNVNPNALRPPK